MIDPQPADGRQTARVVLVGEFTRTEFAPLLEQAAQLVGRGMVQAHGSVRSLLMNGREAEDTGMADLLVILQSWPEEYAPAEIDGLLDRYPLARLMVCYGPWCDSDGRTRDRWPPATRVPLTRAESRLQQMCDTAGPLPLTANRDESYAYDYATSFPEPLKKLSVAVSTPDPAVRDWLYSWLHAQQCTVHTTPIASTNMLIWDVDPWSEETADKIVACRKQRPDLPIIALAGFLRHHEIAQMHRCGIEAVLAKTDGFHELSNVVESLAEMTAARPTSVPPPRVIPVPG